MKSANVIITDDLKEDLNILARQIKVGMAGYVRDNLTKTTYAAFERFYCTYTPRNGDINTTYDWKFFIPNGVPYKYKRTYNILLNGIDKFYENKHGKIIYGGVRISPENMEEVYSVPAIDIFNNIYESGYHGFPGQGLPVMNTSPEKIINMKYDWLLNNADRYKDVGINRAQEIKDYKCLRWI